MRVGRSWYEVLQVDPGAEPEIVEAAYRRLAKKYHPDVLRGAGSDQLMKEINAAYAVLRDPLQRAAYDRQLREQAATAETDEAELADLDQDYESEDFEEEDAGGFLACLQHQATAAVGTCESCGVGLCGWCFDRFQPPSCPGCILGWARQRRGELMLSAGWFFGVLLLGAWICSGLLGDPNARSNPSTTLAVLGWVMLAAYVVASLPSGWRIVSPTADDDEPLWVLLLPVLLGPIVAPFRMLKVFLDMRDVRRLEALARQPA